MHHLTTLNLPTPSSKEADRQWLAEMLAAAGESEITVIDGIEARPERSGRWTANDMTIVSAAFRERQSRAADRRAGRPIGSTVPDSPALVERARALARLGLSRYAAARRLNIGCVRLERLARLHSIEFTKTN